MRFVTRAPAPATHARMRKREQPGHVGRASTFSTRVPLRNSPRLRPTVTARPVAQLATQIWAICTRQSQIPAAPPCDKRPWRGGALSGARAARASRMAQAAPGQSAAGLLRSKGLREVGRQVTRQMPFGLKAGWTCSASSIVYRPVLDRSTCRRAVRRVRSDASRADLTASKFKPSAADSKGRLHLQG